MALAHNSRENSPSFRRKRNAPESDEEITSSEEEDENVNQTRNDDESDNENGEEKETADEIRLRMAQSFLDSVV